MSMRPAAAVFIIMAFQLGGCASPERNSLSALPDTQVSVAPDPEKLVAMDFVNALSQLDNLAPTLTTIDLSESDRDDQFTEQMRSALRQAGYGIRWVQNEAAPMLFQYRQSSEGDAATASRDVYQLAVGTVEMRRTYAIDKSRRIRPVTPLYVRGADAARIVLNDEIFSGDSGMSTPKQQARTNGAVVRPTIQGVASSDDSLPKPPVGTEPKIRISAVPLPPVLPKSASIKLPDEANPLNSIVGNATAKRAGSLPLLNVMRAENVFELGGSNFDNIFSERSTIAAQTLTFPNDSMRLGKANKALVERLVERFNPRTDVFSVIGCSIGPTQVKGGNAALALGRAGRVVEALRFAGVDDKFILDEGCWSGGGKLGDLPTRGVVLTLSRRG